MVGVPETARRHGIRPSKALGQNFLTDPNTVSKIIRLAGVRSTDRILEIGAGFGILTVALGEKAARVIAVEFDRALLPVLEEAVAGLQNVEVMHGDAMKLDFGKLLQAGGWRFISNLPYGLATPLVAHLLESVPQIDDFIVMVQREVGERLVSAPGSKQYGSASVLVGYFADGMILARVPPTVFWPRPKVESVIVHLVRRPPSVEVSFPRLNTVVRAAFGQRRKTIRNSLASGLGLSTSRVEQALGSANIDASSRAENLTLEEFARIAEELA